MSESVIVAVRKGGSLFIVMLGVLNVSVCLIQSLNVL